MLPQTKALALLALATLLTLVAATIWLSRGTAESVKGSKSTVTVEGARTSPGSTASARDRYRTSLGR